MSGCEVPRCGQCARWWHMGEDAPGGLRPPRVRGLRGEVALMGKELWERVRLDDAIVTRLGHLRSAAKQGERGR